MCSEGKLHKFEFQARSSFKPEPSQKQKRKCAQGNTQMNTQSAKEVRSYTSTRKSAQCLARLVLSLLVPAGFHSQRPSCHGRSRQSHTSMSGTALADSAS